MPDLQKSWHLHFDDIFTLTSHWIQDDYDHKNINNKDDKGGRRTKRYNSSWSFQLKKKIIGKLYGQQTGK